MFISQPNNFLITRFGQSTLWIAPIVGSLRRARFQASSSINVSTFMKLLFRCGTIYSHHPFYHKFFVDSTELLSLPVYITEDSFPKFYRIHRLKASLNYTLKKTLMLRRTLKFLNVSSVLFYRLGSWIVVLLYIHLPAVVKQGKPSDILQTVHEKPETLHSVLLRMRTMAAGNFEDNPSDDDEDPYLADAYSYWGVLWSSFRLKLFHTYYWNSFNSF